MKKPTTAQLGDAMANLRDLARDYRVKDVADAVLEDPRFPRWTASSHPQIHHYGDGGLLIHTNEVVDLCLLNNAYFGRAVDDRLVYLAALFHDAGKMWDYAPNDNQERDSQFAWNVVDHKFEIHHISRSAQVWMSASLGRLHDEERDDVWHAILSHHGRREWGSPVTPSTPLAWLLHLCDMMSSRMDDGGK